MLTELKNRGVNDVHVDDSNNRPQEADPIVAALGHSAVATRPLIPGRRPVATLVRDAVVAIAGDVCPHHFAARSGG